MSLHRKEQDLYVAADIHCSVRAKTRLRCDNRRMRRAEEAKVLRRLPLVAFGISSWHANRVIELKTAFAAALEVHAFILSGNGISLSRIGPAAGGLSSASRTLRIVAPETTVTCQGCELHHDAAR